MGGLRRSLKVCIFYDFWNLQQWAAHSCPFLWDSMETIKHFLPWHRDVAWKGWGTWAAWCFSFSVKILDLNMVFFIKRDISISAFCERFLQGGGGSLQRCVHFSELGSLNTLGWKFHASQILATKTWKAWRLWRKLRFFVTEYWNFFFYYKTPIKKNIAKNKKCLCFIATGRKKTPFLEQFKQEPSCVHWTEKLWAAVRERRHLNEGQMFCKCKWE